MASISVLATPAGSGRRRAGRDRDRLRDRPFDEPAAVDAGGVDALEPGEALLVAGKGHETGQIVGADILPFDDVEQASVAVAALDGGVA